MQAIDIKRANLYLLIGAAWMALWLFIYLVSETETFLPRIPNEIWRTIYLLPINFLFFEYAWPFIAKRRKYLLYNVLIGIFLFWLLMMLVSFGLYAWRNLGIWVGIYSPLRLDASTSEGVEFQSGGGVFSLLFFGGITHAYDYRKLKISARQLRFEKQEAELNYLKSQTNPHFLFNTLNNIYSLARDKSNLAPESILRLSKILRFMLYETNTPYIPLEKELRIISDYIGLEKLRYDETLLINFNYNVEDLNQTIPPLLLIPLVENAFKHGASETRVRPFVDIHLSVARRHLVFIVKNSAEGPESGHHVKENIGLSNLRRQLQLLYTNYDLTVNHTDSVFTATLKINLGSHVQNHLHYRGR